MNGKVSLYDRQRQQSQSLTSYIYQYHGAPPATPPAPGSGSFTGSSGWDQTGYTYTPARQLASITDAAGNTWAYGYNLAGDQTSQTTPDTGTTTSGYDPAGQLMCVTDARGKQTSFSYDADGRKTAAYDTTGSQPENSGDQLAAWTYDTLAKGQLTKSVAYAGGTSGTAYTQQVIGYNSAGQPTGTETVISAGPLAGTYKLGYDYDPYTGLTDGYNYFAAGGLPNEDVSIGYDTLNRPASLGSSLWTYVAALSYTELGQPLEYAFGTTTEPAWLLNAYDQQTSRLTSSLTQAGTSPATVSDISYTYDNYGNVTAEADSATGDYQCYHYDWAGRLADAWAQGSSGCAATPSASVLGGPSPYWQHLAYDPAGNITTSNWTYNTTGTNYTTTASTYGPAQPHALASQNVVSSAYGYWTNHDSYDVAGNLTDLQSAGYQQSLTWNDQNKLAAVTDNQGDTSSYAYNADGNLLLQTDNTSVTLYLPDEQLVLDTTTGTVTGTRYYTLGGITVAARTSAGQVQYLTGDQHDTSMTAIDSATLAATHRYYTPFGALRWPYPATWPGTKGFAGGTTDNITALTNLGAREYNPGAGTFTSPDPLLTPYDPQDLNPYAYARNDPTTFSDPTGLSCSPGSCAPDPGGEPHPGVPPPPGGYPGTNPGGRTSPPPVVQVSPHVLVSSSDPRLHVLQAAWQWAAAYEAQIHGAQDEFDVWWRACTISPYRSACTGQFGADFSGFNLNYRLEEAFGAGIKILLAAGASIAGFFVPVGTVGTTPVQPYEVGTYKNLVARSVPGDQLAIHHVPQGNPAVQVIEGYDYINAPTIALPVSEHRSIPNVRGAYQGTPQQLIQQDIANLRTYTDAPETSIQALMDLIESTYPGVLDDGGPQIDGGVGGE